MGRVNRFGFLAIALTFHLVYLFSIFDIYFVSPVVSGMREFGVERPEGVEAPAKRLVLFVGDGLRADKAFQSFPEPYPKNEADLVPRPLAPFLRSRVLEHGTFGVSHTRVPTESRPGHVALIAGLYEDVSAVTTGWKLNPVNFDSVFNRSRHTWCWGSPDILPMFELGAVPGRVDAHTYAAEEEDFSQDALHLDIWVFDKVKALFANAAKNTTLNAALRQDKVVFFLHLLGLDTNGHAYRPYSKEYLNNIKVVDEGIMEITKIVEDFYNDDKTAFVFTADHGMSDWGSHGDGHPDNTRTPLIAWGSGVAKPVISPKVIAPGHDELSSDWGLDHIKRHDVAQADVAALMAYLAGLEFPVNSVGELPLSYLSGDITAKSEAFLANARGIMEMYRVKEERKKATELRYRPYKALGDQEHSVDHRISVIRRLIDQGNHEEAIQDTAALVKVGLEGLRYLQTYDWLFLRALITIGYLGWIAFALTTVIDLHVLHGKTETSRTLAGTLFFSSILVSLFASFVVSKSPLTYYAYAIFPVGFWEEVYARRTALAEGRKVLFGHIKSAGGFLALFLQAAIFLGLIESLAFGYTHREVFSVLFIAAASWPAFYGGRFLKGNKILSGTWVIACFAMSSFTLLAAIKVEDITLITSGGASMVAIGILYLIFEGRLLVKSGLKGDSTKPAENLLSRTLIGVQIGLIILAIFVTRSSIMSLQAKQGLPRGNQILGWNVLVIPLIMPFLHRLQPNNHYLHRLMVIFLTFAPIFVILTISYEGLFYFCFCVTLITWVRLEHNIYAFTKPSAIQQNGNVNPPSLSSSPFRSLTLSDARISLFFLTLLQSAFFSTGNVASVSSFSLDSVYRLIPIFDPFSQGALLMLKLLIPFALISANLGILNKRLGVTPSALFMLVMAITYISGSSSREVRCDAASLGVPCTNCVAFSIECKIPTPMRKKAQARKAKDSDSDRGDTVETQSPRNESPGGQSTSMFCSTDGTPPTSLTESQIRQRNNDDGTFVQFMKPKFTRAPIKEAGRVAYLGESSNLTLLVHDRHGSADVVHYPLPENIRGTRARLTELDNVEIDILHQRGAFLLPPRSLCDELVDSYFKWVAPIVPVINRNRFMKQYRDSKNPPSLLLLQAILLAGSRVCNNPQLMDANGSTTPAALTFYKRAKALYDANYEDDRVTIVQALVLMGWYWEGPEDVTKNVFYWSRVATIVAQGSGMHRSVEGSQLSKADKKLWKRIWWTLFTRDRSVAVALGRPVHINTDDSDVEMISEEDFIEDDDQPSEFPQDALHVQFFLQYVKLCEIMGLVLSQQYSVASKARRQNAIDLTLSDMALADWLQNCPKEIYWEMPRHHFWAALLHSNYYTTLCLLHRAHMPPATSPKGSHIEDNSYPSRTIAFQAAAMITSIIENLSAHDELRYCPAFIVYSLFSALIMHVYQMRSLVPSVVAATQERMQVCMKALKDVSRVWLVAKMVYALFESILGNKVLEERLQKAAGKRHKKMGQSISRGINQAKKEDAAKRKYDDMAMDFGVNSGPAPQESYERSRPQTPSQTPSRDLGQNVASMAAPSISSPNARQSQDAFMGTSSRPHTRPQTPFNPSFNAPVTPPDLYLVTRNSPNLSQSLWENFQPDQLFPEGSASVHNNHFSPQQAHHNLDPNLMSQMNMSSIPTAAQSAQLPQRMRQGIDGSPIQGAMLQPSVAGYPPNMWQQGYDQPMHDNSPSDTWSTGSAQAVPTTLNVEDWFQFFGINGDLSGMNEGRPPDPDAKLRHSATLSIQKRIKSLNFQVARSHQARLITISTQLICACHFRNVVTISLSHRSSHERQFRKRQARARTMAQRSSSQNTIYREEPRVADAAASISSNIRPRNKRLVSTEQELISTSGRSTPSSSRGVSPIPSQHPSRTTTQGGNNGRPVGGSLSKRDGLASPTAFGGIWEGGWTSSWSALQGIASSVLGGEVERSERDRPIQKVGSATRTGKRAESAPSTWKFPRGKWGPTGSPDDGGILTGSNTGREEQVRAKKRAGILEGRGALNGATDTNGDYKKRSSMEEAQNTPVDDRGDALVYIHHVQPQDTLAGVVLRYNCQPAVFKKTNRFWPNDSIQTRKVVVLPVDACAIKGRPCEPPSSHSRNQGIDLLAPTPSTEEPLLLGNQGNWPSRIQNETSAERLEDENPWTHVRWVLLDSSPSSKPVEIARMSRKTLGYFPPRRRKSQATLSSVSTPRASSDIPHISHSPSVSISTSSTPSRRTSNLGGRPSQSVNGSYFPAPNSSRARSESVSSVSADRLGWMRGPGGVGTLGKNVRMPGPGNDALNSWAKKHIPGLALDSIPSVFVSGLESDSPSFGFNDELSSIAETSYTPRSGSVTPSGSGIGLENAAAAIEGWVRRMAIGPGTPILGARRTETGDLIELLDGAGSDDGRGFEPSPPRAASVPSGTSRREFDSSIRGRSTTSMDAKGGKSD
ncbi:hypothetical protein B7494_g1635 [Chlorociboria aeruginascens]|nr:hypothetical protein B7494_g1635 [Chlorociboria aeruginascens]